MTFIKIAGLKIVRANGAVYRYHRATGTRVKANPDSHPDAFLAEVRALEARVAPNAVRPDPRPGALGGLFTLYKASPEFTGLAPASRAGYQRAIDALKSQDGKPLASIDQPYVLAMRDETFDAHGRWLANMVVKMLSIGLGWGEPRGLVRLNAAKGVPKIRRSKKLGVANKAWHPAEVDAILKATAGGLKKAIALAYYGGLRKADVVTVPRSARAGGQIDLGLISKNGRALSIFEAKRLTATLNEPDVIPKKRRLAATLVVNRWGKSYTADGLDSVFTRVKTGLVEAGKIRPGLTFHGLRKSLGKRAADAGFSEGDIAAALGQTNPASSRPYTLEAARAKGAARVFRALERKK